MSKPTKYKVVNLPYPGRVDLFGFGEVNLHQISDNQADEIHAAGAAKKHLIPINTLPQPEVEKPNRKRRKQNLS